MDEDRPYEELNSSTIVTSTPKPKKEENVYQEINAPPTKSTEA